MTDKDTLKKILSTQKDIQKDIRKILSEVLKEEKSIKIEEGLIRDEEELIKKEEEFIKKEEILIKKKEEEIKQLIKGNVTNRKHDDIIDWKLKIWSHCEYKEHKDTPKEIVFFCKKLRKNCNFTSCPLNFV
jgi:hypothetical protein